MLVMDNLDEPVLAELFSYWSERCHGRPAPTRADIDPVDIPHLLPHIVLTEIVDGPGSGERRVRFRLAGTQIEKHFGCVLANRYLDELKRGNYLSYVMGLYERLISEVRPLYTEDCFGDALRAKRLMLPLSDDGRTVNMVLTGMIYSDSDPSRRSTVLHSQDHFTQNLREAP